MDSYYLSLTLEALNKAHASLMNAGNYLRQGVYENNHLHKYLLRIVHTTNTLMEYVLSNIEKKEKDNG